MGVTACELVRDLLLFALYCAVAAVGVALGLV